MTELWDYLSTDLGLPVTRAVDEDGVPVAGPFAVAQALAAQLGGRTEGREIDLRVGELAFRGGLDFSRAAFTYGGSGLVFFLAAVVIMFVFQYQSLTSELHEVEARVVEEVASAFPDLEPEDISSGSMAVAVMQDGMFEAQKVAAAIGDDSGVPPTIDMLYQLSNSFPPAGQVTVDVDKLTLAPNAIDIDAETTDFGSVAQIEASLKRVPAFAAAAKGNENKNSKGKITFTIGIDRGEADEDELEEEG